MTGPLSAAATAKAALLHGTPVNGGTMNAAAEAVILGAVPPGDLMLIYGTTTSLVLATASPVPRGGSCTLKHQRLPTSCNNNRILLA